MTAGDLFAKMDRLKVTRNEIADKVGAFPHTITDFRRGTFEMSEGDAERLSRACDEIMAQRMDREEMVAA